jgi:prepilin-type N-terminal cleavage/methylation domain-containing protein
VKKGFTLVELAIVLVIIGLIAAMAVKGQTLAAAAEMRKEVNKMRKYESAFSTHFAKSGKFVPVPYDGTDPAGWSDNVSDLFLEQGYLTSKDLIMKYSTKNPPSTYFAAELVSNESDPGYNLDRTLAGTGVTNFGVLFDAGNNVLSLFACNIEIMSDDRDTLTGLGRIAYTGTPGSAENFEDGEYADCAGFGSQTMSYGYVVYSY